MFLSCFRCLNLSLWYNQLQRVFLFCLSYWREVLIKGSKTSRSLALSNVAETLAIFFLQHSCVASTLEITLERFSVKLRMHMRTRFGVLKTFPCCTLEQRYWPIIVPGGTLPVVCAWPIWLLLLTRLPVETWIWTRPKFRAFFSPRRNSFLR